MKSRRARKLNQLHVFEILNLGSKSFNSLYSMAMNFGQLVLFSEEK